MKKIDNFNLQQLVVILAIPFTPAFAVNIAGKINTILFKKLPLRNEKVYYIKLLHYSKIFNLLRIVVLHHQ